MARDRNSSLTLVGDPVFGGEITFEVHTDNPYPWITLTASQGGRVVYVDTRGFFDDYYRSQTFTLGPTGLWTGGDAECVADLFDATRGRHRTLAEIEFITRG